MENYIVLIHAGLAVLMILYLLVRLFISFFGMSDKEYQQIMRRKFRIPDWIFIVLLAITGIYPILILGNIEFYHILKIALLGLVIWITRFNHTINFTGATILVIASISLAGYMSFIDSPKFPVAKGTFEQDHPEITGLSKLEKGQVIFTALCTQCHGEDGKLQRFQAADLTQSKLNLEEKVKMIENGSPLTVMRSFKNELSQSEIEAVALYVNQLAEN